jgi:thiol-disulfide isomerase/thioredoxin
MSGMWLASYVVLWAFVALQSTVILALMRQLGLRVLNTGEAVSRDGLPLGSIAPGLTDDILARTQAPSTPWSLVVLASRTCQPCRALIPHLNSFAKELASSAAVALVLDESPAAAIETSRELGVASRLVRVIATRGAHDQYRVRVTPFAFLLDSGNRVVAKGLVNSAADLKALWQHRHHVPPITELASIVS